MKFVADTHTHTIASSDAFSTVIENIEAAKEKGFKFLCVTEHVNLLPVCPEPSHFRSLPFNLPKEYLGIRILRGIEVNIEGYDGSLDVPSDILDGLEWVIASMHDRVLKPGSVKDHTACWLAIAENPSVDVIGHCGDPQFAFDHEAVIPVFAKTGKIVEINNHSFIAREGSAQNCENIAKLCMRYGVPIVVSSDAHFAGDVGRFDQAVEMLERIGFPEELILNADYEKFLHCVEEKDPAS